MHRGARRLAIALEARDPAGQAGGCAERRPPQGPQVDAPSGTVLRSRNLGLIDGAGLYAGAPLTVAGIARVRAPVPSWPFDEGETAFARAVMPEAGFGTIYDGASPRPVLWNTGRNCSASLDNMHTPPRLTGRLTAGANHPLAVSGRFDPQHVGERCSSYQNVVRTCR